MVFLSGILLLTLTSCYRLKGFSVDPKVTTYYVDQFKLSAYNAPPTLNQTFSEALKDKIARESRLKYNEVSPDIEFSGNIQTYRVESVAPQPNETTSFNRLTISIAVEYTNNLEEKDHWTKNFSYFADFGQDQNLLQVQDQLINDIFTQILEDIFNQAFNNW